MEVCNTLGHSSHDCFLARSQRAPLPPFLRPPSQDQLLHIQAAAAVEWVLVVRKNPLNPDCMPCHYLPVGRQDSIQQMMRCRRPKSLPPSTGGYSFSLLCMTAMSQDYSTGIPPEVVAGANGKPPGYGAPAPTPDQLRQGDSVPWQNVAAFAAGKRHDFRVKTMDPVLWRKSGADRRHQPRGRHRSVWELLRTHAVPLRHRRGHGGDACKSPAQAMAA